MNRKTTLFCLIFCMSFRRLLIETQIKNDLIKNFSKYLIVKVYLQITAVENPMLYLKLSWISSSSTDNLQLPFHYHWAPSSCSKEKIEEMNKAQVYNQRIYYQEDFKKLDCKVQEDCQTIVCDKIDQPKLIPVKTSLAYTTSNNLILNMMITFTQNERQWNYVVPNSIAKCKVNLIEKLQKRYISFLIPSGNVHPFRGCSITHTCTKIKCINDKSELNLENLKIVGKFSLNLDFVRFLFFNEEEMFLGSFYKDMSADSCDLKFLKEHFTSAKALLDKYFLHYSFCNFDNCLNLVCDIDLEMMTRQHSDKKSLEVGQDFFAIISPPLSGAQMLNVEVKITKLDSTDYYIYIPLKDSFCDKEKLTTLSKLPEIITLSERYADDIHCELKKKCSGLVCGPRNHIHPVFEYVVKLTLITDKSLAIVAEPQNFLNKQVANKYFVDLMSLQESKCTPAQIEKFNLKKQTLRLFKDYQNYKVNCSIKENCSAVDCTYRNSFSFTHPILFKIDLNLETHSYSKLDLPDVEHSFSNIIMNFKLNEYLGHLPSEIESAILRGITVDYENSGCDEQKLKKVKTKSLKIGLSSIPLLVCKMKNNCEKVGCAVEKPFKVKRFSEAGFDFFWNKEQKTIVNLEINLHTHEEETQITLQANESILNCKKDEQLSTIMRNKQFVKLEWSNSDTSFCEFSENCDDFTCSLSLEHKLESFYNFMVKIAKIDQNIISLGFSDGKSDWSENLNSEAIKSCQGTAQFNQLEPILKELENSGKQFFIRVSRQHLVFDRIPIAPGYCFLNKNCDQVICGERVIAGQIFDPDFMF